MNSTDTERKGSGVVCRTDEASCDALDVALSRSWLRIAIAGVFAGQGMVFSLALNMTPPPFGSAAYWVLHGGLMFSAVVVVAFLGGPLLHATWRMAVARRLSIEGLFTLSLLGALAGSIFSSMTGAGSVYYEVVSVVIAIYTFGRMLSERSQAQLRVETDRLREDFDAAVVCLEAGQTERRSVVDVPVGTRVRVDPGMPLTIDGVVREGVGFVRETTLTGEPTPVVRRPGDPVRAGTWSVDGAFEIETTATYGSRELDAILDTVEDGAGQPSELQRQANRLIQYFLPVVAAVSVGTALFWLWRGTWVDAVLNSMAVLLVACPCALGLATPVAIWNGLFRLSRLGLVSRDGALIDTLARTRHVFFDKTGTLSEDSMQVSERLLVDEWAGRRAVLFSLVHAVESRLSHPIARALIRDLEAGTTPVEITDLQVVPGAGVMARCRHPQLQDWLTVQLGENAMAERDAEAEVARGLKNQSGKRVYVFIEDRLAAIFVLEERLREGAFNLWERLERLGVDGTILTGDPDPRLQLPDWVQLKSGLSAAEKANDLQVSYRSTEMPLFVGDGVNDTAAMRFASASISMGSGAALTQSTASGCLIRDQIEVIPDAIELSRSIYQRLRGNLYYAAIYNVVGMCLAAGGWLHPVLAAGIMLLSSFWVTLRSLKWDAPTGPKVPRA